MHAVVNRVRLREPLDRSALLDAERDLRERATQIEGLDSILLLSAGELESLVLAEDESALERTREHLGDAWIREHIVPHADGPPQRQLAEVLVSYERSPGS